MRAPRFRLRTLMLAVAVAAVLMGAAVMARRRAAALDAAGEHAAQEILYSAEYFGQLDEVRAAYHGRMRVKYERAAGRPWLSIAPDPEPPPFVLGRFAETTAAAR